MNTWDVTFTGGETFTVSALYIQDAIHAAMNRARLKYSYKDIVR